MVKLGASSMFFHEYEPVQIFSALKSAGLDYVEFWAETPWFWFRGAHIEELAELMKQFPNFSPLVMHAPIFDLNPCSLNPGVAKLTGDYTIKTIEMMEELGGGILTIHPGKRTTKRPVNLYDKARLSEYLERLEKAAAGTKVSVAIENMPPAVNAQLITSKEMRELLDEYSWLKFTWDYAHSQESGDPFTLAYECGDRMINIHASCGKPGNIHMPLYNTQAGVELKKVLREISYDGVMTFEFEDLHFDGHLSFEEKTAIMKQETEWFSDIR